MTATPVTETRKRDGRVACAFRPESYPCLARLGLEPGDLEALRTQGFVQYEQRGDRRYRRAIAH